MRLSSTVSRHYLDNFFPMALRISCLYLNKVNETYFEKKAILRTALVQKNDKINAICHRSAIVLAGVLKLFSLAGKTICYEPQKKTSNTLVLKIQHVVLD